MFPRNDCDDKTHTTPDKTDAISGRSPAGYDATSVTSNRTSTSHGAHIRARAVPFCFVLVLLGVEFLDELTFGVREAAWPLIRDDLRLTYFQVGVLLGAPRVVADFIEPCVGVLGDTWRRRALVLAGGAGCALASLLMSASYGFALLLAALVLFNPSAGAFIGLSQATLMDAEPRRREQNMARWTLAGTLGNLVGPLAVGAAVWAGAGWRVLYVGLAALYALMLVPLSRLGLRAPTDAAGGAHLKEGLRGAWRALRRREVLRWLVLLECGDFTWDTLRGFLALYFVDVARASASEAALAVVVWSGAALLAEFFLVAMLERVSGLGYLRRSTLFVVVLFPAFLLAPDFNTKLVCLALLGFANTGTYSIIKAQLYAAMPGQSGTVLALGNASDLLGALLPFALGAVAQRFGLPAMMWLLLAGPLAVLFGVRIRDEG